MSFEIAAAKVNLALHVTGRRSDGYHELDSLVAFADFGDRVTVEKAGKPAFRISGPFADSLTDAADDNLVVRARDLLSGTADRPLHIELEKNIPVASGVGGGSADAAAALRAINRTLELGLDQSALERLGAGLGADVPMCVGGKAARVKGIGDRLEPLQAMPALPAILVNPLVEVSTPDVFRALQSRNNPSLPDALRLDGTIATTIAMLDAQRNDLEGPATGVAPVIADVLAALRGLTTCHLARMSGSGATCFALFASRKDAETAAREITDARPGWWVRSCSLADAPQ